VVLAALHFCSAVSCCLTSLFRAHHRGYSVNFRFVGAWFLLLSVLAVRCSTVLNTEHMAVKNNSALSSSIFWCHSKLRWVLEWEPFGVIEISIFTGLMPFLLLIHPTMSKHCGDIKALTPSRENYPVTGPHYLITSWLLDKGMLCALCWLSVPVPGNI